MMIDFKKKAPLFAIFLFFFFLWKEPFLDPFFSLLDKNTVLFLNGLFQNQLFLQKAVAFINSRYGDWIYEGAICLLFTLPYLFKRTEGNKKLLYSFLILIGIVLFVQIGINTFVCRKILKLSRLSPSRMFTLPVDFSAYSFPHHRIFTNHSFPSDRSTTLFLTILFSSNYLRKKSLLFVILLSIPFALTRLIVGAHWLSDLVFGGFFIAYITWFVVPRSLSFSKEEKLPLS